MIVKLRAQKIEMEMPKEGSEPRIRIIVQRIEKHDNGAINTIDMWDNIYARLGEIQDERHPIVTDISQGTFSVGDLATTLSYVVMRWLCDTYGANIDENGDVLLEA